LFVLVDELNNAVFQAARAVLGDGICVFIRRGSEEAANIVIIF
jgi:hypothetical protein